MWDSPAEKNIYCSSSWSLNIKPNDLSGLSLVVGLAVTELLNNYSIVEGLRIKWPNDILWYDKKLCGILVELLPMTESINLIIGIGLNVNSITSPDESRCSLTDITGIQFDRNILIAKLLIILNQKISQLIKQGFNSFAQQWQKMDFLYGKFIKVININGEQTGTVQGINHCGHLILKDQKGILHTLASGETSITY